MTDPLDEAQRHVQAAERTLKEAAGDQSHRAAVAGAVAQLAIAEALIAIAEDMRRRSCVLTLS